MVAVWYGQMAVSFFLWLLIDAIHEMKAESEEMEEFFFNSS